MKNECGRRLLHAKGKFIATQFLLHNLCPIGQELCRWVGFNNVTTLFNFVRGLTPMASIASLYYWLDHYYDKYGISAIALMPYS